MSYTPKLLVGWQVLIPFLSFSRFFDYIFAALNQKEQVQNGRKQI